MEISFADKKLEKKLSNISLTNKYYGKDAKGIMNRLSELRVADSLFDVPSVPPPRRHKLTGNFKNCWGICFSPKGRIVISPCGEFDINDLKTIKKIEIISLEDYH